MSLRAPTAGLRSRRRQRTAVVELTPLIDIVFQLLIFFLLTATFQNHPAFKVNLPKANNKDVATEPKSIVVSVSEEGQYEIDGKIVGPEDLQGLFCKAAKENDKTGVNIRADQATQHQFVVEVMDAAKTCEVERIGILHGR